MKYRYFGAIPTLVFIEGKLRTVRNGELVDMISPPSSSFVLEEAPKVVAPTVPKAIKPKKRRVILDASGS